MEEILFEIKDYEEQSILIYFSESHALVLKGIKEFDRLIKQLQNMRHELKDNLENP